MAPHYNRKTSSTSSRQTPQLRRVVRARLDHTGKWPLHIKIDASRMGARLKDAYQEARECEDRPHTPDLQPPLSRRPQVVNLADLEIQRTLGAGAEGRVYLAQNQNQTRKPNNDASVYALKASRKRFLRCIRLRRHRDNGNYEKEISDWLHCINNERSKLVGLSWHPFISGLFQVLDDPRNTYMMLEAAPCGNLRSLMQRRGPFAKRDAAFYFANITCALKFLTASGVANRDVKPENIFIGQDGYLLLGDFGQAAYLDDENEPWNEQGTAFYSCPEYQTAVTDYPTEDIPDEEDRDRWAENATVDLYAAATVLFEMLTGELPYTDSIDCLMLKQRHEIYWPENCTFGPNLRDLIETILDPLPWNRPSVHEVLECDWLKHIDEEKMVSRKYIPPYVPEPVRPQNLWHTQKLPSRRDVPGIAIVEPRAHLAHDDRNPSWTIELR